MIQCGSSPKGDSAYFEIVFKEDQKTFTQNDSINLAVLAKLNLEADSVAWTIQSQKMTGTAINNGVLPLFDWPMGTHKVLATVYTFEGQKNIAREFTIVATQKPVIYTYSILERLPHEIGRAHV